ncbi:MAG: zinc ABC transporter substrate-binding protein [Coleofasciculus sp. G1-WW12-02]|uniref:metal ABC transporter solute-binding protein, Zn/Mn family n=1 Tax=Coleofasciculus sp. G1-WW12-02 TaxID=3068483 RepID=UPI0032F76476
MLKYVFSQTLNGWNSKVLALAIALTGCVQSNQTTVSPTPTVEGTVLGDKPSVVASHRVLCDLTKEIAQDTIQLNCLLDPNQDPHTYRATPSHRKAVETAQLILYGGYDAEAGVEGLIEASNTSAPIVAVFEEAVPNPLEGEAHHHDHGEKEQGEHSDHEENHAADKGEKVPDPHVWHDVQNGMAMVDVIRNQLTQINPDQADLYAENAQQLTSQLDQLDTWVNAQVATIPPGKRTIVTTHDALAYYVNAYGFEAAESLQGLSTEETPSAARVKELVETIEQAKVPTIFVETTTNSTAIETVAREADVKVSEQKLIVGSLGDQNSDTGTYIGMITHNTCAIAKGLGGTCTPFKMMTGDNQP